jgi:diacylglycerol kinase (ATP)
MKKLLDSLNYAISGIVHAFKTERNMKIHFAIAILVILASVLTFVTRFELIAVIISITLVFFAEMMNTAIEKVVDMITSKYHELARIAKNMAAGAALVTALNALIVGYLVFYRKLDNLSFVSLNYLVQLPAHITFASLVFVGLVVIIIKAKSNKKAISYLQGGMPSGHTALAFSLFTSITIFAKDPIATTFSAILALIVAESRLETNVHSLKEVVLGALLGVLLTVVIYGLAELLAFQ